MQNFQSDRDLQADITANIENLEQFYGLNKVNSLKQLVQIILDPKRSELLFKQRNVTLSSIFQEKNDPTQLNKDHINVFAEKYSFEKLVEKFPKPKGQINGMLIGILEKKLAKETITSHQTRKNIWMLASGARFNMHHHKGLYQSLVAYDNYPDYFMKQIKKDIPRTVSRNQTTQQELNSLTNVLIAFSRRNPYVGYCQGMNFVVYFLLTMQFTEQQAFWMLSEMIETVIPMDYYTNMIGVVCDQQVFLAILSKIHPEVTRKFDEVGLDPSVLSLQWFVCMFTSSLPFYLVKIVWDRLLIEGPKAFIKAGIIIISQFKNQILKVQQFHEIIILMEQGTKRLTIAEADFNARFQKIFISREGLVLARTLYREYHVMEKLSEGLSLRKRKSEQLVCDTKWPICLVSLQKNRRLRDQMKEESEVWIFRQGQPPFIDPQYLIKMKKKSKSSFISSSKSGQYQSPKKSVVISPVYQEFIKLRPIQEENQSIASESIRVSSKKGHNSVNFISLDQSHDNQELTIGRLHHICKLAKTYSNGDHKEPEEGRSTKIRRSLIIEPAVHNPLKSKNLEKMMQMGKEQQNENDELPYQRSQTIKFMSKFLNENSELSKIIIPGRR